MCILSVTVPHLWNQGCRQCIWVLERRRLWCSFSKRSRWNPPLMGPKSWSPHLTGMYGWVAYGLCKVRLSIISYKHTYGCLNSCIPYLKTTSFTHSTEFRIPPLGRLLRYSSFCVQCAYITLTMKLLLHISVQPCPKLHIILTPKGLRDVPNIFNQL